MTATKTRRHAKVAETLYPDWVRVNTHNSGDDGSYEVMADGPLSVRWMRIGQPARTYRVRVTAAGVAVGCSCKGSRFTGGCLHRTLTTGMIRMGKFKLPELVADAAECMADRDALDGYLFTTERE